MFSVKKQWAFCLMRSMLCLSQDLEGRSMCFLPRTRTFRPRCANSDTTASNWSRHTPQYTDYMTAYFLTQMSDCVLNNRVAAPTWFNFSIILMLNEQHINPCCIVINSGEIPVSSIMFCNKTPTYQCHKHTSHFSIYGSITRTGLSWSHMTSLVQTDIYPQASWQTDVGRQAD